MAGPGEDGRPEYLLSNATAMAMQAKLGSLSQAGIMSAVMAGRGGAGSGAGGGMIYITVQSGSLTMSQIKTEINSSLHMTLGELLPALGA